MMRRRADGQAFNIGKALEANFYNPQSDAEMLIKAHIDRYHEQTGKQLETALFAQKKRLADAERSLATKETKKALEDKRIASNKIDWHLKKLAALKRTELKPSDSRIFPFWYAPLIVMENGKRVIKPMRYHCRPNGKPASYDKRYDGLYNARRDNLEGFWKALFGVRHGVLVVTSFFENVSRHAFEKRALEPVRNRKTLSCTSTRKLVRTCCWLAYGIAGRHRASHRWIRLLQSPMSRQKR
jgi:hypothetical protein